MHPFTLPLKHILSPLNQFQKSILILFLLSLPTPSLYLDIMISAEVFTIQSTKTVMAQGKTLFFMNQSTNHHSCVQNA